MSGHFATLLTGTVRTLLPDHDVHVTDWRNARDVPVAHGPFGLDEFVDHVITFLQAMGPRSHVLAVCQPCVPVLAAVALLAERVRRDLYDFVRRSNGPVTRDEAAAHTGISRRLAAFHLDKLAEEGLLDTHYARPPNRPGGPGAGRPAKWYRPSGVEFDLTIPPRRSDIAARILALTIERLGQDGPHRAALLDEARACGTRLSQAQPSDSSLIDQLAGLGYQPDRRTDGVIELRNCPFRAVVTVARDTACTMNHALLDTFTQQHQPACRAILEPAEDRCCVRLHPA
jgi:predicted ArsR family transcriptional regulator